MYGLIGKMIAVDGQRDPLVAVLLEGINDNYVVTEPVAGVGLRDRVNA